jgi:hypothetical protein
MSPIAAAWHVRSITNREIAHQSKQRRDLGENFKRCAVRVEVYAVPSIDFVVSADQSR